MATHEECFSPMGRMVFHFQTLEREYINLLGYFSDIRSWQEFATICDKLTFNDVLDVVGSIANHKNLTPELLDRLKKQLNVASKLGEQRNRYVHSHYDLVSWGVEGVTFHRYNNKVSRRTGVTSDSEPYDPAKLLGVACDIELAVNDLMELIDDIRTHFDPTWAEGPDPK